jgi:hypothetical protein
MDQNELNDPSLRPIDYCAYLYPSTQLEPREHFIYGGSRIHPAHTEEYIKVLPPPSFIAQLDPVSIQFLKDLIQLIRQGVPPHMKIRIPWNIMAGITYVHTNPYGHAVHRSPHVEALMQIAAIYTYNSTSTYAYLIRHLLPDIEPIEHNHAIRSACPYCENYGDSHHEETENSADDLIVDEESESEFESESEAEEDRMEHGSPSNSHASLIERPHSAPPQLPSPPHSPFQEATCDSKYNIIHKAEETPSDNRIDEEQEPEELQTTEELVVPVPFHPLVLATVIGPFRQPSPPRFEPISLPLHPITPPQQGLEFSQSLIQQLGSYDGTSENRTTAWSDLMRQTLLAVRVFGSDLTTPILNTGEELQPIRTPVPIEVQLALQPPGTPPTHCHEFVFHAPYVLAYGPFEAHNPLDANDPTSQPIDYCVYLHPSNNLVAQEEFVYGGSNIHPVEIIDFPINRMPSLNIVKEFDPLTLQFLGHMTNLFRHGTLPSLKLRIPRRLMLWPTWVEPNNLGNTIHYSPFIEMMLQIAVNYVIEPMGAYAQLLRRMHPEFDMFEDFRITCIHPDCTGYEFSEDEEEDRDTNEGAWHFYSDPEEDMMSQAILVTPPDHLWTLFLSCDHV